MKSLLPHDPVIVCAKRSAIGKYGGVLKDVRPDDMLAALFKSVVTESRIDPLLIGEVVAGCANQAGEDNRNVARMAMLLTSLSETIPAITVNRLCASGLDAVIDGVRRIITGEHEAVLVGGVESMSRAPLVMAKAATGFALGAPPIFDTSLGWRFYNPKMLERTPPEPNGMTAEHLVERYQISRERQDIFALNSHQKAVAAQACGAFTAEITPLAVTTKHSEVIVTEDEGPRSDTSLALLGKLKPAFKEGGSVTAGNSSTLNDGAAALMLTSHDFAKRHELPVLGRIRGYASAGVDPRVMGIGPVFSTQKLLAGLACQISDFAAFEINEAFAAQVLAVAQELSLPEEKLNPLGGAIALGHPLGSSGARLVVTLIHHLRKKNMSLGMASLCVGVGQGVSIAIEAI
jgi:acetyl-CoA acetyltransferase family protein